MSLVVSVCHAQSELPVLSRADYKGKVKTATLVREYLIRGGSVVRPTHVVINETEFNAEGKIIRQSDYGNIERRQTHSYSNGREAVETLYFDMNGQQLAPDKAQFTARTDLPLEGDLCPVYTIQTRTDKEALVERVTETCDSGSRRATIVVEENADSTYFRAVREDAKDRTWEMVLVSDAKDNPLEFRYIVGGRVSKKYSWNITYVNHKSDKTGNLIETTATATHSLRPNQIWFQYIERYEIIYF